MAEGGGSDTISANTASKTVAHGLGGAPVCVLVQAQDDLQGRQLKVDPTEADGTNFVVRITDTDPFNAHAFYWYAST